jgi:hypothetical protein
MVPAIVPLLVCALPGATESATSAKIPTKAPKLRRTFRMNFPPNRMLNRDLIPTNFKAEWLNANEGPPRARWKEMHGALQSIVYISSG